MSMIWKARPTTYKGVPMRSRLEARVAGLFDEWSLSWTYEPRAFAVGSDQYLPDFQIGPSMYVEVKPWLSDDLPTVRRWVDEMSGHQATIRASEPDAVLWLLFSSGWAATMDKSRAYGVPGRCASGHFTLFSGACDGDHTAFCPRCGATVVLACCRLDL